MRILFDQGTPVPLRDYLPGHEVVTAYELGWGNFKNGDLLAQAESVAYELLITTDQNLRYQQNLTQRNIAILVLTSTSWPRIRCVVADIQQAVNAMAANGYLEFYIP